MSAVRFCPWPPPTPRNGPLFGVAFSRFWRHPFAGVRVCGHNFLSPCHAGVIEGKAPSGDRIEEPRRDRRSFGCFSVRAGDIWAIINIFQSSASNEKKLIWILAVVLLPLLGLILWFFLGPRDRKA
ncbi:MAG: PLDc N-terminal domain-containing protein [Thiobacillaceae bacterium]